MKKRIYKYGLYTRGRRVGTVNSSSKQAIIRKLSPLSKKAVKTGVIKIRRVKR